MNQEGNDSGNEGRASDNQIREFDRNGTEESGRANLRATDAARAIANDEMAEIRKLLAGNLLKRFKEIKEAKEQQELEKNQVDEEAVGIMANNDKHSRLHSIAVNQAKQRLTLRRVQRQMSGNQRFESMGRLERKNTIKKNVEEIQGFVPPEVKFRQKQS